jgi:hypothetical protein
MTKHNTESFASIEWVDEELHQRVKKEADKKFPKNSYPKNLWILREYRARGGKIKNYNGKKPAAIKIKKAIDGSIIATIETIWGYSDGEFDDLEELISKDQSVEDLVADLEVFESANLDPIIEIIKDDSLEINAAKNDDRIAEVYTKYHETVNMGYSELSKWAENPCSRAASLSRAPIQRNLRLLSKKRADWTMADVSSANRTISFVSRMRGVKGGEPVKTPDGKICESKRVISLKNWAYRT